MLKRNNRKGFTLAELLIVVAIIAVLVAIAVPLFVGALGKAQDARDEANIRAVKSAAVYQILNTPKPASGKTNPIYDTDGNLYACYMVTGTLDEGGNITGTLTYVGGKDAKTLDTSNSDTKTQGKDRVTSNTTGYSVVVFVTSLDLDPVPDVAGG